MVTQIELRKLFEIFAHFYPNHKRQSHANFNAECQQIEKFSEKIRCDINLDAGSKQFISPKFPELCTVWI